MSQDLGLIGLAVMGQNLALNFADKGFSVAVYNRTVEKTRAFISERAGGQNIKAAESWSELVKMIRRPRRLILMVQAGAAVDQMIEELAPRLEPGDLIVDAGNSHYQDTERRADRLEPGGLRFLGAGVSGGEEGALKGPAIMAGGEGAAYELISTELKAVAAKVEGEPCCALFGPGGAGHLVKMVHNGIEYALMQIIAESYDLLRASGLSNGELAETFDEWSRGETGSFLVEITAEILRRKDEESGQPMLDLILDSAGQKGTGRWTVETALELGVPVPAISAALEARALSALWRERQSAAKLLTLEQDAQAASAASSDRALLLKRTREAWLCSQILAYAQGLELLRVGSEEFGYQVRLAEAARVWRGGCIIRSRLLGPIMESCSRDPAGRNLLLLPEFSQKVMQLREGLAQTVKLAADLSRPAPALGACLSYLDGYRAARLPAGLIQAQRDYFGAHTFERLDRPGVFHLDWLKAGKS